MYANKDIMNIAMRQSALDNNCKTSDFLESRNIIVRSEIRAHARKYYSEPIACNLVSYGNNIVASVKDEYRDVVEEYINKYEFYHCFETPNIHRLNNSLSKYSQKVCFMAEYFLPDMEKIKSLDCDYKTKILQKENLNSLYVPQWSNALCEVRKELDVLAVGAYDNGELIALAGCSADCEEMWQIGVDVLPAYRKRGIAAALTSRLAMEILNRGKVPFYCCAWSNIPSARNAIKSNFIPAWVEMTVKPSALVDEMIK